MQIVIDIPKYIADMCKECGRVIDADTEKVGKAIKNGTPLPKHGRLIDADALLRKHTKIDTYPFPSTTINSAPTIIEADKMYKAEVITRGNCMICGKELDEGLFFCKECEVKTESEEKV